MPPEENLLKTVSKSKPKKASLKKSGDGFPKDVTGQMLFVGQIVTCPHQNKDGDLVMKLGVVRQLFKNGKAKVKVHLDAKDFEYTMFDRASSMLTIVDGERFNPKDPLFEAVKMSSRQIENDDLLDKK